MTSKSNIVRIEDHKQINEPGGTFLTNVRSATGGHDLFLSMDEGRVYDANPDAFAAAHFGLTLEQYRDWVHGEGVPKCSATTKRGTLCNAAVCQSVDADKFKQLHRKGLCHAHREDIALVATRIGSADRTMNA